jgi:5-methylcytosine-specific restriction endonuclease McrA
VLNHRGRQKARRTVPLTVCAECHTTIDLQRHHVDLNPRNNTPANIAILCRRCHSRLHASIRRGTQTSGFWVPTYGQ